MLHQSEFDREFAIIQGRLRLIEWRNIQAEQITTQFEAAWPQLEAAIDQHVAELTLVGVARAHANLGGATEKLLGPWVEAQTRIAAVRAEDDLAQVIAALPRDGIASHAWTVLPAVGGAGLIAASVVAAQAISATGLAFFLGGPVMLACGAALAVLALTGSSVVGKAAQRGRSHLSERMKRQARSAIFADGRKPYERCVVSDTQAALLKAAQTALEA